MSSANLAQSGLRDAPLDPNEVGRVVARFSLCSRVVLAETLSLSQVVTALSLVNASAAAPPPERAPFERTESAPTCADIELRIVTESSDPGFSLVTLATPREPAPRARRAGDGVGNATLEFIAYNTRRMSPAAWFQVEGATCQALLFRATRTEAGGRGSSRAGARPPPAVAPARRTGVRGG